MLYFKEWLNTMKVGGLTIFFAKTFGRKTVARDQGCSVTIHRFMGKSYITDVKKERKHG